MMTDNEIKKTLKTCGKSWFVEAFPFLQYNVGIVSDDVLTEDLSVALKRDYSEKSAYLRFQAAKKILDDGPTTIKKALKLCMSKPELSGRCVKLTSRIKDDNGDE